MSPAAAASASACKWSPWATASSTPCAIRGGLPGDGWDRRPRGRSCQRPGEDGKLVSTGAKANDSSWPAASRSSPDDSGPRARPPAEDRAPQSDDGPRAAGRRDRALRRQLDRSTLQGAKVTPDGLLLAGVLTKMPVGAFRLHLEFRTPYMPTARGQARGNSGVYIQRRYEVQILDSFGLEGVENECGGALSPDAARPEHVPAAAGLADLRHLVHAAAIRRRRQDQDSPTPASPCCTTACRSTGTARSPPRPAAASRKARSRCRSTCRTTATRSPSATSGSCPARATSGSNRPATCRSTLLTSSGDRPARLQSAMRLALAGEACFDDCFIAAVDKYLPE